MVNSYKALITIKDSEGSLVNTSPVIKNALLKGLMATFPSLSAISTGDNVVSAVDITDKPVVSGKRFEVYKLLPIVLKASKTPDWVKDLVDQMDQSNGETWQLEAWLQPINDREHVSSRSDGIDLDDGAKLDLGLF